MLCYFAKHAVPSLHAGVQLQRKAHKDAAASDYVVTDEKAELVEADEDDEDLLEDGDTFRLGQQDEEFHDFSSLKLKDDAHNRQAAPARSQAARSRQYASGICVKYDERCMTSCTCTSAGSHSDVCMPMPCQGQALVEVCTDVYMLQAECNPAHKQAMRQLVLVTVCSGPAAQANLGVPGRPHLPGDLQPGVQAGVRLPDCHRGAGVPA